MHLGWEKTLKRLYEYYWFEGMAKYVSRFIENCPACQVSKASLGKIQAELHTIPKTSIPFFFSFFFYVERSSWTWTTQLQAAWVVSDSYRLKLHGGLPDGCSRRAQDLLRILPSAPRRLSPCWAGDFLVRQKIGAARGDHAP